MKTLSLTIIALTLAGCASMDRGGSQMMRVVTQSDASPENTHCVVKNDDGKWNAKSDFDITVNRDGDPVEVKCENDTQTGTRYIQASFDNKYLWQDFFLDLCTVSCIVDGINGAFHSYPRRTYVEMIKK